MPIELINRPDLLCLSRRCIETAKCAVLTQPWVICGDKFRGLIVFNSYSHLCVIIRSHLTQVNIFVIIVKDTAAIRGSAHRREEIDMSVDFDGRRAVHEEILGAIGLDKEHMRTMESWSRDQFNKGESIQYRGELKLPRSLRRFTRGQIHEAVSVALEEHPGFSYVRAPGR